MNNYKFGLCGTLGDAWIALDVMATSDHNMAGSENTKIAVKQQ